MIREFRDGRIRVVCSVDILGEGFDLPGIEVGILLRPTASEIVYLQQVGRCLRVTDDKTEALILDHVGNTARHGLPTDERDWTLDGRERVKRVGKPTISVRVCPNCFAANRAGPATCGVCGTPYPVESREVTEQAGELVEIAAAMAKREARKAQGAAQSLEQLREIERARGYRKGWADHIYRARQARASA
jgi:superfamily II DNA or RNA helicase